MRNILHEELLNISSRFRRQSGTSTQQDFSQLIVSLTSYPPRFARLPIVLESLLTQNHKPHRILLWIAESDISKLPKRVYSLQKRGIEIRCCEDFRSYKKIIPCLKEFPDAVIVTADDDVIYPAGWLEALYRRHVAHPNEIICHRARLMTFDDQGQLALYRLWPNLDRETSSLLTFPVGVGGVLYPPGVLNSRVTDKEMFLQLAPFGDDIWLKYMSLSRLVRCRVLDTYKKNFLELRNSQHVALRKQNVVEQNDKQLRDLFDEKSLTVLRKEATNE